VGTDLSFSFDEGRPDLFRDGSGHYRIGSPLEVKAAGPRFAHSGDGAALFQTGPLVIEPAHREALFAPGGRIGDLSLEFWLYPQNMENGEHILTWLSSRSPAANSGTDYVFQRIQCAVVKNRLQWVFTDFFAAPDGRGHISLTLTGDTPVVPKTWAHHLIRFDAATGLLEYLVNGKTESIAYASSTGGEGGEVFTPIAGAGGSFTLGSRFSGLIDEFRIRGNFLEKPGLRKYAVDGRIETGAIDLGQGNSGILNVAAAGGRTSIQNGASRNIYAGRGSFSFPDDSAIQFFIRAADTPYTWTDEDWRPFIPGADFSGSVRGRYVQIAADFYPSGDGNTSPYLEEIRITYRPDEPPLPPPLVIAAAEDGSVELSWKPSPDQDTAGYLIYYGTARGEYFGEDAILGKSPINAGKRTSLRIEGLQNGALYYFAVAAYDWENGSGGTFTGSADPFHSGEFSREVRARPLRGPSRLSRMGE
jgi:hypothetical protein